MTLALFLFPNVALDILSLLQFHVNFRIFFFFWLHPNHTEVFGPGFKSKPQLRPTSHLWQCQMLNSLCQARNQTVLPQRKHQIFNLLYHSGKSQYLFVCLFVCFYFCEKLHWNFIGIVFNLQMALSSMDILSLLILLILTQDIFSLICVFFSFFHQYIGSVSFFSVYRFFTYLVKFIL